tara:strand:- start:530 stop:940 length:411 start_codon:yes stop_codon:yes gene_type:complete
MQPLRASIREYRHLALALLVLAFLIRAVIPAGFMVSASRDTVLTVTICADASAALKQMELVIPAKDPAGDHSDGAAKSQHCAFSSLAKAADSGADPVLLVLAFAFILVLGLAPMQRLAFRPNFHLRPPLRGPPAAA